MGLLGSILKIAAPVAGFALGGPAGAMLGSGVSGAISGGEAQSKANKYQDQALQIALGREKQTAPARSRALELALQGPGQREDLSALFADPGNPYSRSIPRPEMAPPVAAQPMAPPVPGRGGALERMLGGGRRLI